jgi:hypothetical protein
MGLSIHYSGSIKDIREIDNLVNEVADICKTFSWSYNIIKPDEDPISGICFGPQECETIFLTFLPDGKLCSLLSFIFKEKYPEQPFEPIYTISVKTQYAGMDAHMAVIKLLRYLKEKYFSEFELRDEGYYWETGDREKLASQFSNYDMAIEMVSQALSGIEKIPGESTDSLAARIERILKEKLGGQIGGIGIVGKKD